MIRPCKLDPFAFGVFVATLCPVAALIGVLVCGIELGARVPFEVAAFDAAVYVLGYLATACIGQAIATWSLPAARSTLLTGRHWRFPVVCGIAVSIAAATLVEQTTDVLGGFFGNRYVILMAAGSVIFWSATATAVVLGIDRLVVRRPRSGQSAQEPPSAPKQGA